MKSVIQRRINAGDVGVKVIKFYFVYHQEAEKHETELERSRQQGTRSGGVAEYRRRPVLLLLR